MLKNLALALGLLAGLSACAAPYGYPEYGYPAGYGYAQPPVLRGKQDEKSASIRMRKCRRMRNEGRV
jgi:hypothetical protein